MNLDHPITVQVESRYHRFFIVLFYVVCVLVGFFVFFSPFPYSTSITNISFYLAILVAMVLVAFRAFPVVVATPLTYPFAVFFLWACLSLTWALNFENTLSDLRGHLLNYLVLFFLVINFFNSKNRLHLLAWIVVVCAAVFSVVGLLYYYVILGSPIMEIRFGGLLADNRHVWTELPVNVIGTLSITAILFCCYFYQRACRFGCRFFLILSASVIFVATILTQSRGTLAAVVVAGIALLFIKKKKLLPVFLAVIVLVIVFSPFKNRIDTHNLSARFKINYVVLEVIKDHPILGIGFGMRTFNENLDIKDYVSRVPDQFQPEIIDCPHSWLLDMTVRIGIIGLALFLLIIFVFLRMSWRIIRHARDSISRDLAIYLVIAFMSYFVIGLAEPLFLASASAIIFYILMAMMTILWLLNCEEIKISEKTRTPLSSS